jgi:hypothetical protein
VEEPRYQSPLYGLDVGLARRTWWTEAEIAWILGRERLLFLGLGAGVVGNRQPAQLGLQLTGWMLWMPGRDAAIPFIPFVRLETYGRGNVVSGGLMFKMAIVGG